MLARTRRLAAVTITALALAVTLLVPAGTASAQKSEMAKLVGGDVVMVQANLCSCLSVPKFQADVSKVLEIRPDFITYNEVPLRNDLIMAPPAQGYAIHRSMQNRYTAATAVAWRTDRWRMVDQGTFRVSNYRGKPPGRNIELGRRFANWVTLTAADGRTISVVSAHVAPVTRGMPDLRRRSVKRIGELVATLSPRGPVFVGGDFNVHYKSLAYPRDLLDAASMVPTYDMLGTWFPTGDHQGATIDYLFARGAEQTWAAGHTAEEVNSDHNLVIGGFSWLTDAPAETWTVTNDPAGDSVAQRAALKALLEPIELAEPGSLVTISTASFDQRGMYRQLKAALLRGVHVQLTTRSAEPTVREKRLVRKIAESADANSWVRSCTDACADYWRAEGMPAGLMMVSNAKGRWQLRIDSDSALTQVVTRKVTLTLRNGRYGLQDGAAMVAGTAAPATPAP